MTAETAAQLAELMDDYVTALLPQVGEFSPDRGDAPGASGRQGGKAVHGSAGAFWHPTVKHSLRKGREMAKNDKAAKQEMKSSRKALDDLGDRQRKAGIRDENPEYWAANGRVIEAEKNVSWWRR
jgi:hypothetical protein